MVGSKNISIYRFKKVYIMRLRGYYREAISEILEIQKINMQIVPNDQKVQIKTLANCHQELGHIYYMQAQYSQAIEKLTNAQTEFEKIGDRLGAAQLSAKFGRYPPHANEYPQAIEKLTNAQTEFEKIGGRLGAAQCLRSLGDIHRMQNEYPQAIEKLTNAQTEFEKIGDRLGAAYCLESLADIHCKQAEYSEAIEKFKNAQTEFEKIGDKQWAAWCLQRLGDIHQELLRSPSPKNVNVLD
ncbi:TPR-like protein [Gymnopus androsaceus JB14]|uniref:TPR-like protein n=1 Tax=Gymnopus androsaceus JB14 TaxID=1447944 RepID=A0A6A4GK62_9AGAR|nr:TPR-like protein [Gymnopus androsaceus JB14]